MKLLTVKEVAEIIGAKSSTIYGWAEQKLMPAYKINGLLRFKQDEVFEWINKHKTGYDAGEHSQIRSPKTKTRR